MTARYDSDTGETGGTCEWVVSDETEFRIDLTGRPFSVYMVYYNIPTIQKTLNPRPLNYHKKPERLTIKQPLRYPRRCRPRPLETPGVNPLNRLKTVNGKEMK